MRPTLRAASALALAFACGSEPTVLYEADATLEPSAPSADDPAQPSNAQPSNAQPSGTDEEESVAEQADLFALSTLVSGPSESSFYLALLDHLGPQTVDLTTARELPGASDLWVHDGAVFLANAEDLTVSRHRFEGRTLVEEGRISFAALGLTDIGFWNTAFVASNKAYTLNGSQEYVVWDPSAMQIEGTISFPELDAPEGYQAFPAYQDRAIALRDGLLYQLLYVTDNSFFQYQSTTYVLVVDVATDSVVEVQRAPCPGLDFTTVGDDGTLYFSAWVFAPGGAAFLDQPTTCVAELAPGATMITRSFDVPDVTGGRQGGALHSVGGGRGIFSVLHDERAPDGAMDPAAATFASNWRFWSYDFNSGEAAPIEGADWNSGAHYPVEVDGLSLTLVAEADYSATTVYRYDSAASVTSTALFDTSGWALRLFQVR